MMMMMTIRDALATKADDELNGGANERIDTGMRRDKKKMSRDDYCTRSRV